MEQAEKVVDFKLEKYSQYPVACQFMQTFRRHEGDIRHRHVDFYELVIFVDGSTLDHWEDQVQILQPGCFFIYAPGTIHNYRNLLNAKHFNMLVHQDKFESIAFNKACMPGFGGLFPEYGKRSQLFCLDDTGLKKAVDLALAIKSEIKGQQPGWEEMLMLQLQQLFIHLWRSRSSLPEACDSPMSFRISRSIAFMEKNLTKNISVADVAKQVSMSESSFRHYFKDVTSFSPIHYLVRLRLKNALQMIFVGHSIAESARLSGLRDSSYLGRMCRKHLGSTLQEICKMHSSSPLAPDILAKNLISNSIENNIQEP